MPRSTTDSNWLSHFLLLKRSIQKMVNNEYYIARKLIEQALFLQSNNADAFFLYSLCLYWNQDLESSLRAEAKAISMNPLCQIYQLDDRDGCLRIKKIIDQAIEYEQKIQKETEELSVNLWYQYSILFHEQTNYQMVQMIYQRLFHKFPEVYQIKTHAFLGNYSNMLYDLGKYQEAIMKYQFEIEHDKNQMRFYSNCSLLYTITGNYQRAEQYIKVALNKMPTRSNFLFNYANILSKVNRFQESLSKLNQALKNDPKDPIFNLKYAINILLSNPEIEQTSIFDKTLRIAVQIFQKCVQENSPDDTNLNKRILSMKNIFCIKIFAEMVMQLPSVKMRGRHWDQQQKFLSFVSDYLIVGQASKLQLNNRILYLLEYRQQQQLDHVVQAEQTSNRVSYENKKMLKRVSVGQFKTKWYTKLYEACKRVQIIRQKNWPRHALQNNERHN